ncbi:MAG: hypothetical protein JSS49_29645 [Planctomycetes bacterium]|nr:hypothetical protein [Planctomycetota bacterium]
MQTLRQFELLENLRPFGSARAVLLTWNGEQYVRSNEEIEIFEFVGSHAHHRCRGFARHSAESNRWEAVGGLQQPAADWLPY